MRQGAVVIQKGDTKFTAYLVGGPELKRALDDLSEDMRTVAAKEAVQAMGEVIAPSWQSRVPVLEGHYRDALELPAAVKVSKTKNGASGSIAPRRVAGVPDDEQPFLYASVLEFGGRVGRKMRGRGTGAYVPAQPSARPAFDASRDQAVKAASEVLRRHAERVHTVAPRTATAPSVAVPKVHVPYRGLPAMAGA